MFAELIANALGPILATSLLQRYEQQALMREIAAAVARAEERFAHEYSPHDPELVVALTKQTRFADLPSVQAALRDLLMHPFHDPDQPLTTLRRSFTDVLPERVDRDRIDDAVSAFLRYLGQEVLYIPQLQEQYQLMFSKKSADNTTALLQTMRDMREDVRQLSAAPAHRALLAPASMPPRQRPYHNLPQRSYTQFVGRQAELQQLTRLMLPHPRSRHFVVTLDGLGGVGKSALALELAHFYREQYDALPPDERFEAIVWVSAKRTLLTATGIQQRRQTFTTLDDLYREIAEVLDVPDLLQAATVERYGLVERILSAQRALLIIDNLETVDDEELLSFLRELPDPTKAIITTRHRIDIAYAIRLTGMPHEDALLLMEVEAAAKDIQLTSEAHEELFRRTGGVPLAIVWSIGLMSLGHSVESVIRRLGSGQSDIARFCFAESMTHIQGRDAERLLLSLALFERSVNRTMLGEVAGLSDDVVGRDDSLAELVRLSLINQQGDRFKLLPLTHSFALEVLGERPELEQELRERWISCLTQLASDYVGPRWRWRDRRRLLAEGPHLVTLADWCERFAHSDELLRIVFGLVQYYDLVGRWSDALRVAQIALEHARLMGDELAIVDLLIFPTTWVLRGMRRYEEAERSISEAVALASRLANVERHCDALVQHSRLLRKLGNFAGALECCEKAESFIPAVDEAYQVYVRANIEYELGRIARDRGDWQAAQEHFNTLRSLFSQIDDDPIFAAEFAWGLFRQLAMVAEQQGDAVTAQEMYQQALDLGRAAEMGAHEAELLVRLAVLEEQMGRHEQARRHAREALDCSLVFGLRREQSLAQALLDRLGADGVGEVS